MLASFGTFVTAINTSALASVIPAILILGLIIAGATYILGRHEDAKQRLQFTLLGGGVAFMATALATAIGAAVPH